MYVKGVDFRFGLIENFSNDRRRPGREKFDEHALVFNKSFFYALSQLGAGRDGYNHFAFTLGGLFHTFPVALPHMWAWLCAKKNRSKQNNPSTLNRDRKSCFPVPC